MKGRKIEFLTPESILKRVSEYDIYRYYIGRDFPINKPFKSVLPGRKDDTPSLIVGNKSGFLYHFDFGDSRYRGNCFNFVQQMTGALTHYDALIRIDKDLKLGILDKDIHGNYKEIIASYKKPESIEKTKPPTIIQVRSKKFDLTELKYWESYYQSEEDLKRENIYSVKELYVNKQRFSISPTEMVFGYLYDDKWKIYRPFTKNKKMKWLTNVPIYTMDGLENIKSCKKAIITKSKKDKMVLQKIFPCVCSVQAENIAAINEENLTYLKKNSKEQYVNFDSDPPGKKNSWEYTAAFDMKHINVPDEYLPIKDFADLAKEKGLDTVKDYFIQKGLI